MPVDKAHAMMSIIFNRVIMLKLDGGKIDVYNDFKSCFSVRISRADSIGESIHFNQAPPSILR